MSKIQKKNLTLSRLERCAPNMFLNFAKKLKSINQSINIFQHFRRKYNQGNILAKKLLKKNTWLKAFQKISPYFPLILANSDENFF